VPTTVGTAGADPDSVITTVPRTQEANDGRSEEEDIEVEDTQPSGECLAAQRAGPQPLPALR
jgi:hypothetical protein